MHSKNATCERALTCRPKLSWVSVTCAFVQYMWLLFISLLNLFSGSAKVNYEIFRLPNFRGQLWKEELDVCVSPRRHVVACSQQGGVKCQVLHAALLLQLSLKTGLVWSDRHFPSILVCSSKHEISPNER